MKILVAWLLLLFESHRQTVSAQLTVDILTVEGTVDNVSVSETYSFPTGFSNPLDWFGEPYANIPSGPGGAGFVGVLYHPIPHNACAPILNDDQRDCAAVCGGDFRLSSGSGMYRDLEIVENYFNMSKIALVDDYHVCTRKKLEHLQQAGFDGMITFTSSGESQNVNNRVYDNTEMQFFDLQSQNFPVAVVSEDFAQTLLENAANECLSPSDCQLWRPMTLVRVKGDSSRQGRIQIGIGMALALVVVGVPLITCAIVCLCCIWCCCNCRCSSDGHCVCSCVETCRDCCAGCRERCNKKGVYEIHELQNQVLGQTDESVVTRTRDSATRQSSRREEYLREREESLHNMRRSESENETRSSLSAQFRRTYENSMFKEREFSDIKDDCKSCTICLVDFEVGEKLHALPCDDGHVFHSTCIDKWLETNSVCPVCRRFIAIPNH